MNVGFADPPSTGSPSGGTGGFDIQIPNLSINIGAGGDPGYKTDLKQIATRIVNAAEFAMRQNLRGYEIASIGQSRAVRNFDALWDQMVGPDGLTNSIFQGSSVGQRSIAERNRGGVYDYFRRYRDPIVDNPRGGLGELLDKAPFGEIPGTEVPVVWALVLGGIVVVMLVFRRRR